MLRSLFEFYTEQLKQMDRSTKKEANKLAEQLKSKQGNEEIIRVLYVDLFSIISTENSIFLHIIVHVCTKLKPEVPNAYSKNSFCTNLSHSIII